MQILKLLFKCCISLFSQPWAGTLCIGCSGHNIVSLTEIMAFYNELGTHNFYRNVGIALIKILIGKLGFSIASGEHFGCSPINWSELFALAMGAKTSWLHTKLYSHTPNKLYYCCWHNVTCFLNFVVSWQ